MNYQQQTAIAKLQQYKVGALFMAPGTGKTFTALKLIASIGEPLPPVLWLGPLRVLDTTKAEVAKRDTWGLRIEYAGIESLSSRQGREYLRLAAWLENNPGAFMVVDESSKVKNAEALRTGRVKALGAKAKYRLILSGTPVTRNLLDLWAQMEFLSPLILGMGIAQFKSTYCETVTRVRHTPGYVRRDEWIVAYHNLPHLYSRINPYVYGCDLELELRKHHYDRVCRLDTREAQAYADIKRAFLNVEKIAQMGGNIFLSMCQKLQQSYSLARSKVEALAELTDLHGPMLVFCKYKATAEYVRMHFPMHRVLTYGKHSFGLNLQEFNRTVFVDLTWDYAQTFQAQERTYRTGQVRDCHYHYLHTDAKLDGLIARNQKGKAGMLDMFKELGEKIMDEL